MCDKMLVHRELAVCDISKNSWPRARKAFLHPKKTMLEPSPFLGFAYFFLQESSGEV